jgi:predicted aspartyl protease
VLVYAELIGPVERTIVQVLLDTGASTTVVSRNILRALGCSESVRETTVTTPNGKVSAEVFSLNTVRLGGHIRRHLEVVSLPLDAPIGGLLGADFLSDYVVTIDYPAGTVEIRKP